MRQIKDADKLLKRIHDWADHEEPDPYTPAEEFNIRMARYTTLLNICKLIDQEAEYDKSGADMRRHDGE